MQKQYNKGQTAEQDCRSNTTKVRPQNRIAEAIPQRSNRRTGLQKQPCKGQSGEIKLQKTKLQKLWKWTDAYEKKETNPSTCSLHVF
jgi:hypothetical protein